MENTTTLTDNVTNTSATPSTGSKSSSGGLPTAIIISIVSLVVTVAFAIITLAYNFNKLRIDN